MNVSTDGATISDYLGSSAFRILQESLTNVARHAKATKVSIRLAQTPTLLRLEVKDNGVGISTHCLSATDTKSLGVIGMRERALACGGELDICPNSNGGTTVSLRVPLNGAAPR